MRDRGRFAYISVLVVLVVVFVSFFFVAPKFTSFAIFEKRYVMPLSSIFDSSAEQEIDLDASPTSIRLSGMYSGNVKIYARERSNEKKYLIFDSSSPSSGESQLLDSITGNAVEGSLFFVDSCVETCELSNFQNKLDLVIEISGQGHVELNKLLYMSNPLLNNPPKLVDGLDTISVKKGSEVSIDLSKIFVDADDDSLIYLASNVENIDVRIVGNELKIFPKSDSQDELTLNIKATDLQDTIDTDVKIILVEGISAIDVDNLEIFVRDKYKRNSGHYEILPRDDGRADIEITTLTEDEKKAKEIYQETPQIELAERLLSDEVEVKIFGVEEIVGDKVDISIDKSEDANINTDIVSVHGIEKFDNAIITLPKTGDVSKIFHCSVFDNDLFLCLSGWEVTDIPFTDNGDSITFEVNDFSGYAGGLIEIIDVQSYPMVGGYWNVRFNTTGIEDLTITPINGTTFTETPSDDPTTDDDLNFVALKCGGADVPYQEIKNGSRLVSIFIPAYDCPFTSTETSIVLTEGRHDIEFQFGASVGYARNNASFLYLNTSANVVFNGAKASMASGNSITTADFNGDTIPDLAIGSADSSGPGRIDVFYGPIKQNGEKHTNTANITFVGIRNGDLNNAFLTANASFFIIGAPLSDTVAGADAGQVFIFKPQGGGGLSGTVNLSTANITINGTFSGGQLGKRVSLTPNASLASLDLVISSPGNNSVYLIRNSSNLIDGKYLIDNVVNLTIYSSSNDNFGDEVILGYPTTDSLSIAAPLADTNGFTDNGAVYIYFSTTAYSGSLTNGNANVTISGNATNLKIGEHQSGTSGDRSLAVGLFRYYANDLAIGVKNGNGSATSSGIVAIFYNLSTLANQTLNISNANLTILGNRSSDAMGSVAFGNVNNDYFDDLVVAAPSADYPGLSDSGEAYVFYGASTFGSTLTANKANITVSGNESDAALGTSLAVLDLNQDDWKDLAIGAPGMQVGPNGSAGKTFVFFSERNITGCGAGIGSNGTIYVKNNVSILQDLTCIDLTSTNLTIDCQGYNIFGHSSISSDAITSVSSLTNVTIQNCKFSDFRDGIVTATASRLSIINNTFNRTGIGSDDGAININDATGGFTNFNISGNYFENATFGIVFRIGTVANIGEVSNNTFRGMGSNSPVNVTTGKSAGISSLVLTQSVRNMSVFNNSFFDGYAGIFFETHMTNNTVYFNNFTNNSLNHIVDNNPVGANNYTGWDARLGRLRGNTYSGLTSLAIFDINGDDIGDTGSQYPYNNSNGGNVSGGAEDPAPWPVNPIRNVTVIKSDSPDPAYSGSTLTYSITLVGNISTNNSATVTVNESYPSQITFANATPSPNSGTNIWTIQLNGTSNYTINITANINPSIANGTVINNTVAINFTNTTGAVQTVTTNESTTILTIRNISVSKNSVPEIVVLNGSGITYQITLTSTLSSATNVTVNDTYPSYINFSSSNPAPAISPNVWQIELNETGTFVINVSAFINSSTPNNTMLLNNVSINFTNITGSNEFKNATDDLLIITDVRYLNSTGHNHTLLKFDRLDPVIAGENLTYVIQFRNNNSFDVNVTLTERYDPRVTYVSSSSTPQIANHTWNFSVPSLTNQTLNITVNVNSSVANNTQIENLVNTTIQTGNAIFVPLAALQNTTVVSNVSQFNKSIAGVGNVTKDDLRDPAFIGQQLDYTILLMNYGNEARNFTVTDIYPSGVLFNDSQPSPTIGNDTWSITLGALGNTTINITVNITANITNGSTIANIVNVSYTNTSDVHAPTYRFSDTEYTDIYNFSRYNGQNGIVLYKTDSPDPVHTRSNLAYSVYVVNNNESSFNGTIVENFDSGTSFVDSTPSPNSTNTWNIEFQNNSIYQLNITVYVDAAGGTTIYNLVNLTYSTPITNLNTTLSTIEDTLVYDSTYPPMCVGECGDYNRTYNKTCIPEWLCTSWSPSSCIDGSQSRTCVDTQDCGYGRPKDGTTRVCEEIEEEVPIEEQAAVSHDLVMTWFWLLWFLIVLMIVVIGLCSVYLVEKNCIPKRDEETEFRNNKRLLNGKNKFRSLLGKLGGFRKRDHQYYETAFNKIDSDFKDIDKDLKAIESGKGSFFDKFGRKRTHEDYKSVLKDIDSELESIGKDIKVVKRGSKK